jgi:phage tail sheath protein FI
MPGTYTYPGVYVEEVPSGVHPIAGVSTSDTAFIDFFARGPVTSDATANAHPVRVTSYAEFERRFGGLHARSESSYQLRQYFTNGGAAAWIVRVTGTNAAIAMNTFKDDGTDDCLDVAAANAGAWGNNLQVGIDRTGVTSGTFTLVVREVVAVNGVPTVMGTEVFRGLTMAAADPTYAPTVVNASSELVRLTGKKATLPKSTSSSAITPAVIADASVVTAFKAYTSTPTRAGADGDLPTSTGLTVGWQALEAIAPFVFNILCLPGVAALTDAKDTYAAAAKFCEGKRAFLIVDVPAGTTDVQAWVNTNVTAPSANAATYFPRITVADPLAGGLPKSLGASGSVAGIFARTDASRGVWKAPAGTDASIAGATLERVYTDADSGNLNVLGINILRTFPIYGNVVWGARTQKGADAAASEWKYVPVRRTALYIEESLYQGLKWVVFEPNDEPLWAQIRLNVGSFMHGLYREGAFAGATPRDAYLVKCDSDTTTQADVDRGIVNILVGFLPLKPAEFVVLRIQQMAGHIET